MRIAGPIRRDKWAEDREWHQWWAWRPVRMGACGVILEGEVGKPTQWVWREWVMRRKINPSIFPGDPWVWEYRLCE